MSRVSGRIVFYYTSAVFILGLTVSSFDPILTLPQSHVQPNYPGGFVVMAERAGLTAVAWIINIVMIIATLSVATVDLYVTVVIVLIFSNYRVDVFRQCLG